MNKRLTLFLSLIFSISVLTAQQSTISGTVTDKSTGDALIGATISVDNQGVVTDFNGEYSLKLEHGEHALTISYVGYNSQEIPVNLTKNTSLDVELGSDLILNEIVVTADIAVERETPVAFSNIPTKKLDEELASQDLPMILNSTPGAYATQSGGGDGDARITIRGFNQRNVAVMLDGIPVNDMENGWVYWSNWFGLDLVTKTMQVQRGLGASKLANPSVGGTINILTRGIESDFGVKVRQEIGNNGYTRSTFGITSGRLDNGWGVSVAASFKKGDGWVDQTYTHGYFYYLRVDKEVGKHLFSASGFGAPQYHGQRSFKSPILTFDADYARDQDVPQEAFDATLIQDKGLRYNEHWGTLNGETINTRRNYYHKPQFSLRHSYNPGNNFYLSNVAYLSIGNGGGTGTFGSFDPDSTGQLDLNKAYEANIFTSPIFKPEPYSESIIRASVNNHFWYGLLSTARYDINPNWTVSGGVDLRDYEGAHYREVYDLLGGDYFFSERNARIDESTTKLYEGDRYWYNDKGFVRWGGLFGLLEYKNDRISAFVNLSGAMTGFKGEDYMGPKQLDLNGETFYLDYDFPFEKNGVLYTVDNPAQEDIDYAADNGLALDTESAQNQKVDWIWIPNFTFKTGASYKINDKHNVFINTGYLSKATRYNNVINSGFTTINREDLPNGFSGSRLRELDNYKNEQVFALELGYGFKSSVFSANVNGYYTKWNNKPLEFPPTVPVDPSDPESERIAVNINGLAAIHQGIEIDFAFKPMEKVTIEGLASIADWKWDSAAETTLQDGSQYEFDAKGVHVGDAAQIQFGGLVRYEPIKGLYFKLKTTYFGKNYADFDPESLKGDNAGRDSWKMPDYNIVDFHAGYNFKVKDVGCGLRFNVINALDNAFITDAQNNDRFTQSFNDYDAKSASVFFGQGRRWNLSLQLSF